MCLGWLKVIIDEGLYDKAFVRDWCVGFDELRQRVDEYPLERVAQITGVPAEDIAAAARMYANADGAVIPWTPITDQQLSSTSAIRLHSILRAVTGNLDVVGGETFGGFSETYIPESEIGLHERLSPEQKRNNWVMTIIRPLPTARQKCSKSPRKRFGVSPTLILSWAAKWRIPLASLELWPVKIRIPLRHSFV